VKNISVTGGTGFVGRALIERLKQANGDVVQLDRKMRPDGVPEWSLGGATEVVIHAAARVHVMNETAPDPLAEFRKANVEGTLNLARQAAQAGVRRFVYVSTVKVNGESTTDKPFTSFDAPAPLDPYGVSKLEAEQKLLLLSRETGLDIVIVRPSLVYGPGVLANFYRLMQLVKIGVPLPLGAIYNRRSMVALENLVDLLVTCSYHPNAAGQTFMVSDDNDVSISELLRMVAGAMGRRSMLLPVPARVIAGAAALFGQSALAGRLLDSLQVDVTHTKSTLGWLPVASMQEAVNKTVAHFLSHP
jgi:nucleoside-diphosphate-sugar epimerase